MEVVSECALRASSLLWMPRPSTWALTVVCKATYRLVPGEAELAHLQEDPNEEDNHWNDDGARSLYAASDLAPRKPRCDVLLVGNAFAPGGTAVPSFSARLAVAGVDKSIEIFGERFLLPGGHIHHGAPALQVPLRYERAAGGPGTANPVGMRADAQDERGVLPLPPLQPPGASVHDAFHSTAGFGPIAPLWPDRQARAVGAAGWTMDMWRSAPMPPDVDPSFFNVAPLDQQVDSLRPDETLFLENLHREHAQLITRLPGVVPLARIERRARATDLTLVADTLWIDTDRAVATLTWRGHVHFDSARTEGRVVIRMDVQRSHGLHSYPDLGVATPTPAAAEAPPDTMLLFDATPSIETTIHPNLSARPTLPFAPGASPRVPANPAPGLTRPSRRSEQTQLGEDPAFAAVLPFPAAPAHAIAPVAPPALVPAQAELPEGSPWVVGLVAVPPPPQTVGDATVKAKAEAPASVPPASEGRLDGKLAIPVGPIKVAALVPSATSDATDKPKVGSLARLKKSPPPQPAAVLTAAGASDAAAQPQALTIGDLLDPPKSATGSPLPAVAIELLWFDPGFTEAIRKHPDWSEMISTIKPKPRDADFSDGAPNARRQEAKDRREVSGVLARARPETTDGLHVAFARAIDEDGRFEPPLVVAGGELALPFDEIETLKATVAVISPLAGPEDKRLKEILAAAQEALRSSWGHMAERLTEQLRETLAKDHRSVPLRSLETHIERILLEGRHVQKRTLLGQPWIRATLSLADGQPPIPVYLPAAPARELPALQRFPARLIAEVRAQLDQYETAPIALRGIALGRVISPAVRR